MRRINIASIVLASGALLGASMVSCGPSKAEKEAITKADSIIRADSIARVEQEKVEAARQNSIARIEAARRDSIARLEEFQSKIPDFSRLLNLHTDSDKIHTYLTGLGFIRTKKGNIDFDGNEEVVTYQLKLDGSHYCVFEERNGYEWFGCKFSIVGAPDQLKQAKSEASRLKTSYEVDGVNAWMEIKENSIAWGDGV